MNEDLKFSIVVPTFNEENDIRKTLDLLVAISYNNKEIIVVDDSTDRTPDIVSEYEGNNVVLIRPPSRKGRCEARNIGINNSKGDVIIILNADVLLPSDFIHTIKKRYDEGYDAVSVMNLVENLDSVYSRYVGMHNYLKEKKGVISERRVKLKNLWWTEGFSARRKYIMQTSLFPSGFSVPIEAGEDVRFVDELRKLGCKGYYDDKVVIKHIAPSTLNDYWDTRKGRGAGTPQVRYFVDGWNIRRIKTRFIYKALRFFIYTLLVLPVLRHNYQLAKFSNKNVIFETFAFSYAWIVEQFAMLIGEFRSIKNIVKTEKI